MDISVFYTSEFVRIFSKLELALQEEVKIKIISFRQPQNHKLLNVHKLHGRLKDRYSFWVNYKYRIVFKYINKNTVALITVGDHDIYKMQVPIKKALPHINEEEH